MTTKISSVDQYRIISLGETLLADLLLLSKQVPDLLRSPGKRIPLEYQIVLAAPIIQYYATVAVLLKLVKASTGVKVVADVSPKFVSRAVWLRDVTKVKNDYLYLSDILAKYRLSNISNQAVNADFNAFVKKYVQPYI